MTEHCSHVDATEKHAAISSVEAIILQQTRPSADRLTPPPPFRTDRL